MLEGKITGKGNELNTVLENMELQELKVAGFTVLPALRVSTVSVLDSGPYVEIHHRLRKFQEGGTLYFANSGARLEDLNHELRQLRSKRRVDTEFGRSTRPLPNLSARRNPIQAVSRGPQ